MNNDAPSYHRYRFPPEIISHAVWLYHRFCLSFRDVEDLLAERGITVTYETVRQWCRKFGPEFARRLKRRQGRLGDTWHLDELFVTIQGQRHYLWRAVDQDGDVIDILVQPRRDRRAAERFFRKLLKGQGREPRRLVTDKLRSYAAAQRTIMPSVSLPHGVKSPRDQQPIDRAGRSSRIDTQRHSMRPTARRDAPILPSRCCVTA
jgi:putative transposase